MKRLFKSFPCGRAFASIALFSVLTDFCPLMARDAFVLLSGGGTPLNNEYSQFVQARAMSNFFLSHYPPDSVWIFFGAGNKVGEQPILADVHQTVQSNGLPLDNWVPGALPHNHQASREVFLKALKEEILPAIADGGTLFLFVGDHGHFDATTKESHITMWQLTNRGGYWNTDDQEILTVSELKGIFQQGLGKGRVVFCMTQCYSGGFHFLSLPRELTHRRSPTIAVDGQWSLEISSAVGFD